LPIIGNNGAFKNKLYKKPNKPVQGGMPAGMSSIDSSSSINFIPIIKKINDHKKAYISPYSQKAIIQ